jgi:hypothetical protein
MMITTKGRLLTDFLVSFRDGELHVSWVKLEEGEDIAILLDRLHNQARLYAPLGDCRQLAALHQYELVFPPEESETFVSRVERLLQRIHPTNEKLHRPEPVEHSSNTERGESLFPDELVPEHVTDDQL